jgi:hypothetical protein
MELQGNGLARGETLIRGLLLVGYCLANDAKGCRNINYMALVLEGSMISRENKSRTSQAVRQIIVRVGI